MSAVPSPRINSKSVFQLEPRSGKAAAHVIFILYALALASFAFHLYRTPSYAMDSIQYMGNALLMEDTNIVRVHAHVYSELRKSLPQNARENLLGNQPGAPPDQNLSRRERATNPQRFAEFLPLFAIRPLYNQTLWLISKTGIGLVRAGILISVASYFGLGLLLFVWIREYASPVVGAAFSVLLMISPPLVDLGRETTADSLATLVAFTAIFLIIEKTRLLPGFIFLLASIYFRTDFVVLAGLTLLACWWKGTLDIWKASILAAVAAGSVLVVNHFSGDYGFKMLYYRNFISVPFAPAEMVPAFSLRDYVAAFRSGVTLMMGSFFLPFLALGVIGLTTKHTRTLFAVTSSYLLLHFAILPNWQDRWFGLFYLAMGVCAASSLRREFERTPYKPS
jgi:hypothetical protein